ncbi:MAG: zf-HC2 domain-containing protein [Paracoccaceae bacterium]
MPSCNEVAERASALIDGELGKFDRLQIRLHLAMCKGCAAFIGQMRTTRDLTQLALPPDDLPDADDARISAILSQLHDAKKSGG